VEVNKRSHVQSEWFRVRGGEKHEARKSAKGRRAKDSKRAKNRLNGGPALAATDKDVGGTS